MRRAEAYVCDQLAAVDRRMERRAFDLRCRIGSTARPSRTRSRIAAASSAEGANLIASLPGFGDGPALLVGAHLDSVDGSPGTDDDASGVAVVLETARLLSRPPVASPVFLALFTMGALGLIGARHDARELSHTRRLRGTICPSGPQRPRAVLEPPGPRADALGHRAVIRTTTGRPTCGPHRTSTVRPRWPRPPPGPPSPGPDDDWSG
ncbi:hypothetical protein GCM10010207_79740 [Streptomyces atratus]|uniref:M28 family peptidase n=1 Tax=Streptomyces atratus TaxID=1893 RepID=UPI00198D386A|nr:M28 family peptidase [Streptomyces atratus]GGT69223.1 hypothetical protein GCM10010207_79740 [Streptomyces atratus]